MSKNKEPITLIKKSCLRFKCSACNRNKPTHQSYTRFYDTEQRTLTAEDRLKISSKVLVCRMCTHRMRRWGKRGVLQYLKFQAFRKSITQNA